MGEFSAKGSLEEATASVAGRLVDQFDKLANLGGVAILGLHGDIGEEAVGERLAGLIAGRTSRIVAGPAAAGAILAEHGADGMLAELNPSTISEKAGWEYLLVGVVELKTADMTARVEGNSAE